MTQVRVQQHVRRRARLPKTAKPKIPAFHTITADVPFGELLAKREREQTLCESEGKLFGVDELLGDDEYVFLSVGKPMTEYIAPPATCFLFDAEELVRRGALVRLGDIFLTDAYDDFHRAVQSAQQSLLTEYFVLRNPKNLGPIPKGAAVRNRRLEELESVLGNEFEVLELDTTEMSKDQLKTLIRLNHSVAVTFRALEKERDQDTLRGAAALEALRKNTPQQRLEILVPKRLSLFLARKVGRKEEF